MMQRIATLPKKLAHPEAARYLNKFTGVNSNGIRWASIAPKGAEKKREKDDRPFIKMEVPEIRPLYLDAQATNPMDPRVLDAMLPYMTQQYGNPHSRNHFYGWESERAVEIARLQVANLIGADPKEIIFTSGATESNNIAIKGVARFYGEKRNHIITTQTEHKCVLDSCRALEAEGFKVTYLPVKTNGLLDLKELERAITPQTALVSVMTVHNEIGVRQPIADISAICKARKVLFHTDAAQAVGKIPIDVHKDNINLMSISGHKVYGPKGIGALYVGRKPRVRLVPIQSGGGQERGLRSGTVPAPLAVGMGSACEIAQREMAYDKKWIDFLSKRLHDKIMAGLTHVIRNGDPEQTYPGCLNLSFAYVEGESLMMALKDVALSSGSACTSASLEPSYVLRAIGTDDDLAHSSIRSNRKKNHFITVQTEHKCILESARAMESEGFKVTFLPVKKNGLIDLKQLEETITPKTSLVSVMTVNNEIGVIQPIAEIGTLCEKKKVLFHTDAAQAVGKIPIDVRKQKIKLMSISGHKLYGPKGVGALFRSKHPPVEIVPHTYGGGQEFGLRSGTVPTPLVVGFGRACEICQEEMERDYDWVSCLSKRFRNKIHKALPHVLRNGCAESNYPGCFNLSFTCVEASSLITGIKDVAVSSGSACSSSSMSISYVLKALGIPEQQANGSLRFGIGRFTTLEEIDYTAERCIAQVRKLREMSPLWEMVQEGVDLKTIIWAQH